MKKIALIALSAVFSACTAFALHPGDRAPATEGLKMIRGKAIEIPPKDKNAGPQLRALVFLLCRTPGAASGLAMLEDIRREYPNSLAIEVVSLDSEQDAEELLKSVNAPDVAFGIDAEHTITPKYMAGRRIYPTAFLIGRDGVVLWCGEAMDMAEKIPAALDGKLSVSDEAEVSRLVAELQQLMRDNSESRMSRTVERIFAIDPGNAAALRLRLFTLENTGRIEQAKKLVDERIKAAPELVRLYFTAADLAARRGCSDAELERLAAAFERNIADADARVRMGWMLLERFPYHPSALRAAARMLRSPLPEAPLPRANAAAGRALLEYRLGNTQQALELQREAVELLNRAGSADALESAKNREAYYKSVLELSK